MSSEFSLLAGGEIILNNIDGFFCSTMASLKFKASGGFYLD
jgi:hypothetical protein